MYETKFEIGTVYKNVSSFSICKASNNGWKCIGRKVAMRKNARHECTREIITARFVLVNAEGKEIGRGYSLRVTAFPSSGETVQWGGKRYPLLQLEAVSEMQTA